MLRLTVPQDTPKQWVKGTGQSGAAFQSGVSVLMRLMLLLMNAGGKGHEHVYVCLSVASLEGFK